MYEVTYNVLVLMGYVAFAYLLNWGVDKAWWAYIDSYLRKQEGKSTTTDAQRRNWRGLMSGKSVLRL